MTSSGVSKIVQSMALTRGSEVGSAAEKSNDFDLMLSQKTAGDGEAGFSPAPAAENRVSQRAEIVPTLGDAAQTKQSFEMERSDAARERITKADNGLVEKPLAEGAEKPYEEWKEKVKKVLTEKLGISEEELADAMGRLGITFEDLLTGNGLQELCMELTGAADITDLLFDGSFQELMQEVSLLTAQLTEQTEMTPEELQILLQEAAGEPAEAEAPGEPAELPGAGQEAVQTEAAETAAPEEKVPLDEALQNVPKAVEEPEAGKEPLETEEPVEEGTVQPLSEAEELSGREQEFSGEDRNGLDGQWKGRTGQEQESGNVQDTPHTSFQTTVQNTVTSAGETVVQTVQRTTVDVQDLIRQVSEFTRVTVTREVSSIQMQLNPEHLGKLFMQLSAKEGVITAQLFAQNEAVKQALESQVHVLKENMNNQGMKVEAVEVAVASHEFEEQFQEQQQTDRQQEENAGHRQRRFLNVDQLEELSGQLSEEDSLAAKIMVENGNSVDLTA